MKLTWQKKAAVAICVGVAAVGSVARTQERTSPERTAQRSVARKAEDIIHADVCHVNFIDRRQVAAARAGILKTMNLEEGYQVKDGEMVAKVKDEVAAAQFATADKTAKNDIEIRFAEKSAEVAQVEYMKALQANGVLSGTVTDIEIRRLKLAWERAVLQKENAEKEHDVAGSKRDEAGELLQTHVVESPITGLVTKVYKRAGEAVREGDPIIDVVNVDRMRVSGFVPFKEVSRVKIGDRVLAKIDVPNIDLPEEEQRFEGRITFIDAAVQGTNPVVKVYAEVINRDGILRDGAAANMVIYPGKTFSPPNATTQRELPRKPAAPE